MIDTDNIRCTGSLKPGNFGLPFIHIVLCCFKNFIYVYISADIRLAAHGGLQVAIMTMRHAYSTKRNDILERKFRSTEFLCLAYAYNTCTFDYTIFVKTY